MRGWGVKGQCGTARCNEVTRCIDVTRCIEVLRPAKSREHAEGHTTLITDDTNYRRYQLPTITEHPTHCYPAHALLPSARPVTQRTPRYPAHANAADGVAGIVSQSR